MHFCSKKYASAKILAHTNTNNDTLSSHDSAKEGMSDDTRRAIEYELNKVIKENMSVD
ncbi:DUF3387 domain-containing protein [Jeotgalicoccus huakuii]|nr:DUF3387 domain-containing protein [Jeotgalicoccus huakuii]